MGVVFLFLLAGFFVFQVTQFSSAEAASSSASSPPVVEPEKKPELFLLQVDFVAAPDSFEVDYLGKEVMRGSGPALTFKKEVPLSLPREGMELVLKANWPEKTATTAVRFRCFSGGDTVSDRTFWADHELAEVILVR